MKQCLVVDDSRTMRRIVSHMVTGFGFACQEAEDGSVAHKHCETAMPDLIMLDWNMPIMNGIDFIQILRKMRRGSHPRVIFCTTESDNSFIESALLAGCDEYVIKPFDRSIIELKLIQLGLIEELVL